MRRRAWQGREIPLEDRAWTRLADASAGAGRGTEDAELFAALREEPADVRVPGMRAHLDGCPACAEDFRSLRDLVAGQGG